MTGATATSDQARPPAPEPADQRDVLRILAKHGRDRGGLIAILQEIQARYGYLPEQALRAVSEETGRSLVDVYGIATFYRAFSMVPRGKHLVCACLGTACHVRGAPRVVEELERQLGVRAGQTTLDGQFTLETVNCLGACALGPIVVIDGRYFSKVRKARIRHLLEEAKSGVAKVEAGEDGLVFPIDVSCPRCNHSLMDPASPVDGRPSIRVTVSFGTRCATANLSALHNGSNSVCAAEIPEGTACRLFCPRCHGEMAGPLRCAECGATMAPMIARGGGMVHVCTRRGCPARRLDLDGANA
jgi:NADH:ubiquinone oxidoreductase subunit E